MEFDEERKKEKRGALGGDFSVNTSKGGESSKIEEPKERERGTERRENYRIDIKL